MLNNPLLFNVCFISRRLFQDSGPELHLPELLGVLLLLTQVGEDVRHLLAAVGTRNGSGYFAPPPDLEDTDSCDSLHESLVTSYLEDTVSAVTVAAGGHQSHLNRVKADWTIFFFRHV